MDVYTQAPEGTHYVITRYRQKNSKLRTQALRIIRKAGVPTWLKPFHNLRSSRQTELAETYPMHVVCAWIGNSSAWRWSTTSRSGMATLSRRRVTIWVSKWRKKRRTTQLLRPTPARRRTPLNAQNQPENVELVEMCGPMEPATYPRQDSNL